MLHTPYPIRLLPGMSVYQPLHGGMSRPFLYNDGGCLSAVPGLPPGLFKKGRPFTGLVKSMEYPLNQIYFYLTANCNLRCRHCWISPDYSPQVAENGRVLPLLIQFILEGSGMVSQGIN